MSPFLPHLVTELRAGVRNPAQMMMSYLFPLGFFALMGGLMTRLNPGFTELLVPAMALFCLLAGTLLGLPGTLVEGRVSGVHRGLRIHGVPAAVVVASPVLSSVLHGGVAAAVTATLGPWAFGGHAPAHLGWFALCLLVSGLSLGSLGALIGVVSGGARSTMLLTQAVFLPSMLLGGLMVPWDALPASLRPFSGLLPTTWAMLALRGLADGVATPVQGGAALGILATFGLGCFGLALALFTWDTRGGERRLHVAFAGLALLPVAAGALLLG